MLFSSWTFLLFFAGAFPVYLLVKNTRWRIPWLLLISYVFYAWVEPWCLLLLIYTTLIDYLAVYAMEATRRKKLWLTLGISNHLLMLGFFKYGAFLTNNINLLLDQIGVSLQLATPEKLLAPHIDYLLPIGISFYTFGALSYLIDFYYGRIPRERSLLRFAAFVALFPQILAGPITRARDLLPQLQAPARITRTDITDGLSLCLVGLFKKIAIADYLAQYVNPIYAAPEQYAAPALLAATFAFAWQIYCDFSGYTDMARGVARIFGFNLMLNFNNPYLAHSLPDFWNRWHISLSSWFKDYVYIPLGGNRRGTARTYGNILVTMALSGLWHGAAWNFIFWGVLHALGSIVNRNLERLTSYQERVPVIVKQAGVFVFVLFTWIFFRAATVGDAWLIITRILQGTWADPRFPILAMIMIAAIWIYAHLYESRGQWLLRLPPVRIGLTLIIILFLLICSTGTGSAFIYFQF